MRAVPFAAAIALSVPAVAQAPADLAGAADIRAIVAEMTQTMRDGRGFLYRPLLGDGTTVAGLEYWRAEGPPAVHPDDAEYGIVIDGAGTLESGGTMIDPRPTQPGLVEGSRIDGGTSRALAKGDVFLIPAGIPHRFGITGGKLVLLGMKLPRGGR